MDLAAHKETLRRLTYDERCELRLFMRELDGPFEPAENESIEAEWDSEIQRRIEDIKSGRVKTIPAEEVMAELRQKYL